MSKAAKILAEELEKNGIKDGEVVIMSVQKSLESTAARLVVEGEDQTDKMIGMVASVVVPALHPVVEKLADLNKDGQIG